jgi:hypothetical protein
MFTETLLKFILDLILSIIIFIVVIFLFFLLQGNSVTTSFIETFKSFGIILRYIKFFFQKIIEFMNFLSIDPVIILLFILTAVILSLMGFSFEFILLSMFMIFIVLFLIYIINMLNSGIEKIDRGAQLVLNLPTKIVETTKEYANQIVPDFLIEKPPTKESIDIGKALDMIPNKNERNNSFDYDDIEKGRRNIFDDYEPRDIGDIWRYDNDNDDEY